LPSIDPVVARVARLVAAVDRRDHPAQSSTASGPAHGAERPRWRCTFVPSADLVARGVRVDTVRKRLSSAGEILDAAPPAPGGIDAHEQDLAAARSTLGMVSGAG